MRIEPLNDVETIRQAAALFDRIWESTGIITPHLMRAIQHAGGYVVGVWDDDTLVAASVAFLGLDSRGGMILHSHITGVLPAGRGIGAALKAHQREWCQARHIAAITWTFDPLVARNGYFNLGKLRAIGTEYLVNHYGIMDDGVNAGSPTDRLHVRWDVADAPPAPAGSGPPVALLEVDDDGGPLVRAAASEHHGRTLTVQVPPNIEALRRTDPDIAARWRMAVRETMGTAMAGGYVATSMAADGTYRLDPDERTFR